MTEQERVAPREPWRANPSASDATSEQERAAPREPWRYNPSASGATTDPLAAPAISWPTTDAPREPAGGAGAGEATWALAIVGILMLSLVLFAVLMAVLRATVL